MMPNILSFISKAIKVIIVCVILYIIFMSITGNKNLQISGLFRNVSNGIKDVYQMLIGLIKGQAQGFLSI